MSASRPETAFPNRHSDTAFPNPLSAEYVRATLSTAAAVATIATSFATSAAIFVLLPSSIASLILLIVFSIWMSIGVMTYLQK
jgi:hypothetical protein